MIQYAVTPGNHGRAFPREPPFLVLHFEAGALHIGYKLIAVLRVVHKPLLPSQAKLIASGRGGLGKSLHLETHAAV